VLAPLAAAYDVFRLRTASSGGGIGSVGGGNGEGSGIGVGGGKGFGFGSGSGGCGIGVMGRQRCRIDAACIRRAAMAQSEAEVAVPKGLLCRVVL